MNVPLRDDRILPLTRLVSVVIVPFLLAGFVILYLFPDRTEQLFAWTIEPRMTPLLMGAGYLAGGYFFLRAIFSSRWHEVGAGFVAISAFVWPMGIATLLHLDRFNQSHITFWLWVLLYAVTPFLIPFVYWLNSQQAPQRPQANDVLLPRPMRLVFAVIGIMELILGLAMFLFPAWATSIWPWSLTPLTARIVAGWFTLPGAGSLLIALDPRWSAARIMLEGNLLWLVLLLIAIVRAWDDFDPANVLTWIYIGGLILSLITVAVLTLLMGRQQSNRPVLDAT